VIAGCEAAWEFFGGVFAVLIPDNLKPVIADADAVNPQFSQGWLDYAGHAGFLTDPARVASPKDKPRVERAVQYVRRNFWDGETFTDLEQAQLAAVALLTRSALTCSDCSRPSNLARWPTRRPNAPPWPASTNSAIIGFLETLLADEVSRRESRSAALRATKAGLDPTMRFDTWTAHEDLRYDRTLLGDLTSLRFLDAGQSAIVLGPARGDLGGYRRRAERGRHPDRPGRLQVVPQHGRPNPQASSGVTANPSAARLPNWDWWRRETARARRGCVPR